MVYDFWIIQVKRLRDLLWIEKCREGKWDAQNIHSYFEFPPRQRDPLLNDEIGEYAIVLIKNIAHVQW